MAQVPSTTQTKVPNPNERGLVKIGGHDHIFIQIAKLFPPLLYFKVSLTMLKLFTDQQITLIGIEYYEHETNISYLGVFMTSKYICLALSEQYL